MTPRVCALGKAVVGRQLLGAIVVHCVSDRTDFFRTRA